MPPVAFTCFITNCITLFLSIHRSWTSTLAEDIDSVPPTTSKIENLINVLERYVKQFGRVSRKQLDPIVSHLDKEGKATLKGFVSTRGQSFVVQAFSASLNL